MKSEDFYSIGTRGKLLAVGNENQGVCVKNTNCFEVAREG